MRTHQAYLLHPLLLLLPRLLRHDSFDRVLDPEYQNRVFIHRWQSPSNTHLVSTLGPLESFVDSTSDLRVTVGSLNSPIDTAVLWLDGYNDKCVAQAPVVTVIPATTTVTSPGCLEPVAVSFEVRGCSCTCHVLGTDCHTTQSMCGFCCCSPRR